MTVPLERPKSKTALLTLLVVLCCPQDVALGTIFSAIEANKERLGVRDYAVSQTSLEEVFLAFAKAQHEETNTLP